MQRLPEQRTHMVLSTVFRSNCIRKVALRALRKQQTCAAARKDLSQKLADALAFCRAKGKRSRSCKGKPGRLLHGEITSKTASAVKAVINAIKGSILASSEEGEAVEDLDAPSSPLLLEEEDAPGDMVGDAAAALQRLQEAFGESQGSATACSSTSPHA